MDIACLTNDVGLGYADTLPVGACNYVISSSSLEVHRKLGRLVTLNGK